MEVHRETKERHTVPFCYLHFYAKAGNRKIDTDELAAALLKTLEKFYS